MTTRPITKAQIETTFGDRDLAQFEATDPPATTLGEWGQFRAFLVRPYLPEYQARIGQGVKPTLRILGLDMLVMIVLISGIEVASRLGVTLPENVNSSLDFTLSTVALVVIAAPLGEELIFRSWLRGSLAMMAFIASVVFGLLAWPFAITAMAAPQDPARTLLLIGPLITVIVALLSMIFLRNRPIPDGFKNRFALSFWFSCVAFALVHFFNYKDGATLLILALLLPQFALGTMLGYLRVHYGLVHAIALHALHNGILFSLAILGEQLI